MDIVFGTLTSDHLIGGDRFTRFRLIQVRLYQALFLDWNYFLPSETNVIDPYCRLTILVDRVLHYEGKENQTEYKTRTKKPHKTKKPTYQADVPLAQKLKF